MRRHVRQTNIFQNKGEFMRLLPMICRIFDSISGNERKKIKGEQIIEKSVEKTKIYEIYTKH